MFFCHNQNMHRLKIRILLTIFFFFTSFSQSYSSIYASTEFGIHFASQFYTPSSEVLQQLHPQWLRYGPVVSIPYTLQTFPSSIKTLVIFNNESVTTRAPLGSTDNTAWKNYVDQNYIPQLTQFLASYHDITALEVWNEEDQCTVPSCGGIPAASYAYMLKNAAATIKHSNPTIKVIIGGLSSGQIQYIKDIKNADSAALSQVDGVGFHPYGKSPGGWCVSGCPGVLPFGDLATAINEYKNTAGVPVWITEIGANVSDTAWQADYLSRVFTVMQQTGVAVGIWYDIADGTSGTHWGLLDPNNSVKPSGQMFEQFTPQLSSLTTTPVVSPIIVQNTSGTISLPIFLHGIGKAGDNVNLQSVGNANPLHQSKPLSLLITDANNNLVASSSSVITYASGSGNFLGTVNIDAIQSGSYRLNIKIPGFLSTTLPGFLALPLSANISIAPLHLVAGDTNNDNQLDILDYNNIVSCFGSKQTSSACTAAPDASSSNTDIDDDGIVSGSDYNLFLRELSTQKSSG